MFHMRHSFYYCQEECDLDFQHRLYELRRKAGLSQEELADLLGVTRQAVQKWEAGTSRPDMDNLTALAAYFNVTLDYLVLGREGGGSPPAPVIHNHYGAEYEYKSKTVLFGLPLVHIHFGLGPRLARGIIAIGNISVGVVSIGGVAVGVFSLGGLAIGLLFALAGFGIGALALGGFALGIISIGGIAAGYLAWGGICAGVYSVGGLALGSKIAIGGIAYGPLAIGDEVVTKGRSFLTPLSAGELELAAQAVRAAAPRWVAGFLEFVLRAF